METSTDQVQTYEHTVPVDTNQSVILWYQGMASLATLCIGGHSIDQVDIGSETTGQLNFLSGVPIHRALSGFSKCEVKFISTDATPPVVTAVAAANNLTWSDINADIYYEDVVLTTSVCARKNNILVHSRVGDSGMCGLRYAC